MQKNFMEINEESCGIGVNIESLEGGMLFLSNLIDECENHTDGAVALIKNGVLQKQLNAIYSLFKSQLKEVSDHNQKINNVSDEALAKK